MERLAQQPTVFIDVFKGIAAIGINIERGISTGTDAAMTSGAKSRHTLAKMMI